MKTRAKTGWHKEAKAFFRQLNTEYDFSADEARVVVGTTHHLHTYWTAAELMEAEGMTVAGPNGMVRKHPAAEIAKNAWAAFLAGCRLLGVCQPVDTKKAVGRPGMGGR